MSYRLCVDAGATWTRLCLTADGRPPRRARLPGMTMLSLDQALRRCLARWKVARLDELVVGAKGAWASAPRSALRARLRPLARRVAVMSDAELAWRAAFGNRPGILVIGGTGSAAVASRGRGAFKRAGGYGPLLGDEGSAFWIGREGLKRMPDVFGKPLASRIAPLWQSRPVEAVRRVAALSLRVLGRCRQDARARAIRGEAAQWLAGLTKQARREARLKGNTAVACHGGLFQDADFKRAFAAALGPGFRILPEGARSTRIGP